MSIRCLMNGLEVNYPCSPNCALFGDCVAAFESQKKANVRTNSDRIRSMSDKELANFLAQKFTENSKVKMLDKGEIPSATYLHLERETWFRAWMQWLREPAEDVMANEKRLMVNLEDIVDLDAQTKANNEAMRKAIAFLVGGAEDGK